MSRQADDVPHWPPHSNPIVATLLWLIEQHTRAPVFRDLDHLEALAASGVSCRAYAPLEDPGGTFEASRALTRSRLAMGSAMLERPFFVSRSRD